LGLCDRLKRGFPKGSSGLLSNEEITGLRRDVQEHLAHQGILKNVLVDPGQPFALDLLEGLLQLCGDADSALPSILREGVKSGVDNDIPASSVFPTEDREAKLLPQPMGFGCCTENWASADDAQQKVLELLQAEEAEGWVERFPGTIADAEARWPGKVAVGKLALVTVEGKDDRLVGDSKACGASPAARFPERAKHPTPASLQEGLSRAWEAGETETDPWCAVTIDVKAAHKRIRMREQDGGLSLFQFMGILWRFVVCHFGASWSAFWYARVGAALHRLLHRILWDVKHLAWVYVDDTLLLLRQSSALESTALVLMLFAGLGVPLSWHKIAQGPEVPYLGLWVSAEKCSMGIPDDKVQKFLDFLNSLRSRNRSDRRSLQSFVGALQWASAVLQHLRPWLAAFYRCVNAAEHASSRRVRISAAVVRSAKLWSAALRGGPLLLACRSWAAWPGVAAADAWAAGDKAGVGGWWKPCPSTPWRSVFWFRLELTQDDLKHWIPLRGDLQKDIAFFELLAQIALLVLKCRNQKNGLGGLGSIQWCDNTATVGACENLLVPETWFRCL